jgi:hypothetical protein
MRQTALLLAVLALFASAPLSASERTFAVGDTSELAVMPLPEQPGRFSRILADYRALRGLEEARMARGVAPNAVSDSRATRAFGIPAAGAVRGAGNTYFHSDVSIVSYKPVNQDVAVFWAANGASGEPPAYLLSGMRPNVFYTFEDFVGNILGLQGLGALYFVPVVGEQLDDNGAIDGYSRIWTNQPNATGTVSQPFDGVDPYSFIAHNDAAILGLRQDAAYRTNYGLCNLDDVPHTFSLTFAGPRKQASLTVTVPATAMIMQSIPAGDYGNMIIHVVVDNPNSSWVAFASSTDNITGDGWVSIGSFCLTPDELGGMGY